MTIELSVREVREALLRHAGPGAQGEGEPATLLLGTIFHRTFADLVSSRPEASGLCVIAEHRGNPARRLDQLVSHCWSRLVAPRLLGQAATLQSAGAEVLGFWRATRDLCRWLDAIIAELLEAHAEEGTSWEQLASLLEAEVRVDCEVSEPGWTEPVRLVGIADAVLRLPRQSTYCAIELKLGRAAPVVDLGQVVLYHLILTRSRRIAPSSALSLLRFSPELEETLVESSALGKAEGSLLALIGELAGVRVDKETQRPRAPSVPPPPAPANLDELGRRLVRAYREYGVGITLRGEPVSGPRFVRFEVRPTPGTRMEGVRKRTADVKVRLELEREPMIVEDAGRVFVDLERQDPRTVLFSSILDQLPEVDDLLGSARVPIGIDPGGRLRFADLSSSGRPHVLVAGTTGSGKSEWLRTALAGLIATNTPDTLRLVTLDPKLAAFADLEGSRYLWRPDAWWIPGGERGAGELFAELIEEMDRRFRLVHESGADTIAEHVERTRRPLPRIVCFCDEYFALISQQRAEKQAVEDAVGLLGAKGRAAGVHLVLATQQPSRKTITGAIQANLPCRVALYLQSPIESAMILGQSGAERLTGAGDLLYKDFGNPVRLQAPYLPGEERVRWLRA